MLSAKSAAAVFVWSIAGLVGGGLFLYATPWLEGRLAPILVDQSVEVEPSDRSPGKMCWTWKWNKVRYGRPVSTSWSISVEGTSIAFPAITERERDGSIVRDTKPAPLGPGQNDLCARIPADLDKTTGLTIRGQINYSVPHGLWSIWQELPVVKVPPIT